MNNDIVQQVVNALTAGFTEENIKTLLRDRFHITQSEQIDHALSQAREQIRAVTLGDEQLETGRTLLRLETLLKKAIDAAEFATALKITMEIHALREKSGFKTKERLLEDSAYNDIVQRIRKRKH